MEEHNLQPKPQFRVIKDFVANQIADGALRPGDRVPSEKELVERFSVSRMTVNRALNELAAEGTLSRVQGLGTFVAISRTEAAPLEIRDISEEIAEDGRSYSCRRIIAATETHDDINSLLGLPKGSTHFHALLVHSADGVPVQLENRWVNPEFAPNFLTTDLTRITPHRHLMSLGPLQAAEYAFDATLPDDDVAELMDVGLDHVCTELRRRTWSLNIVASYAILIAPRGRRQLHGRLGTLPAMARRLPPIQSDSDNSGRDGVAA